MSENIVNETIPIATDPISALPNVDILDNVQQDNAQRIPLLLIKAGFVADNPDIIYNETYGWSKYSNGIWVMTCESMMMQHMEKYLISTNYPIARITPKLIRDVLQMVKTDEKILVADLLFDSNLNIIVCENGTYELDTYTFRETRPDDYATVKYPFAYDSEATCPNWNMHNNSLFNPQVASFMQEYAAYSLTTDCDEEMAVFLVGPRGGGKSTFIDGICNVIKPRVGILNVSNIGSQFGLTPIINKTLLTSTEQPGEYIKNIELFNAIVSGEPINIEEKRKQIYTYRPYAKLIWSMNQPLRIKNLDDGATRRIKIVKIKALEPDKIDRSLKKKIAKEKAGIFNWLIEGLKRLDQKPQKQKLIIPEVVKRDTEEYLSDNDIVGAFIEECLVKDANAILYNKDLYRAYVKYCSENGHKPKASNTVGKDFVRLGLVPGKNKTGRHCVGVKLIYPYYGY